MTVVVSCDYCGQPIEDDDLEVQISALGWKPDHEHVRGYIGHYHSEPSRAGESSCYERMREAIGLAHDAGPTLETIETASGQWVAAQRRKFRKGGGDA